MKSSFFYTIIGGFGAGVITRSFFVVPNQFLLFLVIMALVFAAVFRIKNLRHIRVLCVPLFLLVFVVGVVRMEAALPRYDFSVLEGEEVMLTGVVHDEPSQRDTRQRVVVEIEGLEVQRKVVEEFEGQKVILWTEHYPRYHYGERLVVEGEFLLPEDFETDTGRTFRYSDYLLKDDIRGQIFTPEITKVGEGEGNMVQATLFSLRRAYVGALGRVLPEPASSLASGITVGVDDSLGSRLEEVFRRTGIIHIVVLSGFNVTIVAESIMRVTSSLSLTTRSTLGFGAIILFMLLTGASATIVRASIMASLVILSRFMGGRYDIARALAFAGFVMVLHNPLILAFDPSFQLSFLATLGLIYIAPLLDTKLKWVPIKWGLREIVSATISAQIAVLPFLVYQIGELSIVSLPVNILVLPLIPLAMLLSFGAGVVGFVGTTLAVPLSTAAYIVLEYVFRIAGFFSSLPGAAFIIPPFPWWIMVGIYTFYIVILTKLWKRKSPQTV